MSVCENGQQQHTLTTLNGDPKPPVDPSANSTELDPCLNEQKDARKFGDFLACNKYITTLEKRTTLDRRWIYILLGLFVCVLLLFFTVVGLAIGWPHLPHTYQYPVCRKPECLRAASQIQENLNISISPCTNLWGAFCAKWSTNDIVRPPDQAVYDQKQFLVEKEYELIRNLISTFDMPLRFNTVEWKLKEFYESCLDVSTIGVHDRLPLTKIISELGGWYILGKWNDAEFSVKNVMKNLHVRYGVSPFFSIHIEPDSHVANTSSIRISPAGLGLPDKEYYYRNEDDRIQTAYKEYIRDVLIYLGTAGNTAAKFGQDIFSYEKRIAEITPSRVDLLNPIATYNLISLSELEQINMGYLHSILQAMYPEANISENTEVIVTSMEYLNQIFQIISTTDRQTMNGYLMWTLVRKYLPFLSEKFTSTLDTFNSELFGITKPRKRWEYCTSLTKHHMGLAVDYHLENAFPISNKTREILHEIFDKLLTVMKRRIKKFQNNDLFYQHLQAKLKTISLQIGLPESIRTADYIKTYFHSLKIITEDFFDSVKNAIVFRKEVEEKMLLKTLTDEPFLHSYLADNRQHVKYVPSRNEIVIAHSLLMKPFFENGFPIPIIYGRLGWEIAKELVSAVLPYDSLWTSDRKILSPFHKTVNGSFQSVQQPIDCLSKYLLNSNVDVPVDISNETALNLLKELSAVSVASEALQSTLDSEHHMHQGGLESYEDLALFFLSYAQTHCSDSTRQYQLYDNIMNFNLNQKSLLHITWAQLTEFQQVFDCTPNSKIQCARVF